MMRVIVKLWAFLVRDFLSDLSYRFGFVLQLVGMFFMVAVLFFSSRMVNPATPGLDGVPPFPWLVENPEEFAAMVAYLQTLGRAKNWRPDKDYER